MWQDERMLGHGAEKIDWQVQQNQDAEYSVFLKNNNMLNWTEKMLPNSDTMKGELRYSKGPLLWGVQIRNDWIFITNNEFYFFVLFMTLKVLTVYSY